MYVISGCIKATTLPCYRFRGKLFIYLGAEAATDVAMYETRKAIRALMNQAQSFSIENVQSFEYLAPNLVDPAGVETSNSGSKTLQNQEGNSTSAVSILSALGGFFVVLAMFAAYRFRKDQQQIIDGPSTISPASEITAGDTSISNNSGTPSPPFTGMLPGNYRMRAPYSMTAILEDSSQASISRDSDIIVSECGYTDDDASSRDQSYLNSMLNDDPILGARGMEEYDDSDDDYLYDNSELPALKRKSTQTKGIGSPQEV